MGKRYLKQMVSVAMVLSVLIVSVLHNPVRADAESTYWLHGEGSGANGISALYYEDGKFYISGRWSKGSTYTNAAKAYSKKKNRKMMCKIIKEGNDCLIGEEDYDEETEKVFIRYDKFTGWYGDNNISGLICDIQIKNNRVVKIIQGA